MKKLFATLLIMIAIITFTTAQNGFVLYKMTNTGEVEIVLKTLTHELKLSEPEVNKVRELLYESAKGQAELFQKPQNSTPEAIQNIVRRQTGHIEGSLEEIIGGDKFKKYLQVKPTIEKKLQQQ